MLTQALQSFSTILHLLPLSIVVLLTFGIFSHYRPVLLAAATAKQYRPPVAGWSYCSTCHQNEVCDNCGQCHYCNDILLPCAGVIHRYQEQRPPAAADHRAPTRGPENDDELGESPLKHHHIVTPLCNDMITSDQATPAAHQFTLQPQAQRTPLEALIYVETLSCSRLDPTIEDLDRLRRAACIYEMQPQGGIHPEEGFDNPLFYNSDLFDITDDDQPQPEQPGSGDGKVAQPAAMIPAFLHQVLLCQQQEQPEQPPRRLPVVDAPGWMIIRPRRDQGQQPPEDNGGYPAILPPSPDKPTPSGVIVLVMQSILYNQQGGHDHE